jgi:hypothetical protein
VSGFSSEWLNLREEADQQARDPVLLSLAKRWLEVDSGPAPVVVDLGAGTGSTLRAFTATEDLKTALPTWRLVDHDETLLSEAVDRHGDSQQLESYPMDLADISALPLQEAHLVTASALFDLVSADFLEALAATLGQRSGNQKVGVYAALNYDGTTDWEPPHPLDNRVLAAFNKDQRRDKGFGPALGPDAARQLPEIFSQAGFEVHTASSPWQLGPADKPLVSGLIEGIVDAVATEGSLDPAALADWKRFRQLHAATGTCRVGHTDILAVNRPR